MAISESAVTMKIAPEATGASVGAFFCSLSRPAQAASAGAVVLVFYAATELKKRRDLAALVAAGEECMLGDEDKCESYDTTVESMPFDRLKKVAGQLVQTNRVAAKLADAPPDGFEWGLQI